AHGRGLEHASQLLQVAHELARQARFRFPEDDVRVEPVPLLLGQHAGADLRAGRNQPFGDQRLHGFPDHRAADPELLAQPGLGRNGRTGRIASGNNGLAEMVDRVAVDVFHRCHAEWCDDITIDLVRLGFTLSEHCRAACVSPVPYRLMLMTQCFFHATRSLAFLSPKRRETMAAVQIRGVEKYFGATQIIRGVDIDMEDGAFTVLVGPSGCGKSTLLRMIAGLEEISGGEILIGGKVVNNMMPKERDIAMVFQNYALYPHMTVRDTMTFSLMLARQPKEVSNERVRKAADILGLNDLLDRFPRQLSGGQRQRVAMGRCIVRDPQVFLFDEPLSNLDAKLRVQMRTEIKELHQRLNTTSVYVTHDQIEAMTMADKIVVMRDGVVEQTGSPLEVYDRPANLFVAGFIGSPAMNFMPGVLRRSGSGAQVEF